MLCYKKKIKIGFKKQIKIWGHKGALQLVILLKALYKKTFTQKKLLGAAWL